MSHRNVLTPRRGFTLLEVLLTLAMSVVLMMLIGSAIKFYADDLNVRNMEVREVQVAAAVLQMIEDDMRATLHGEPIDTAALATMLTSAAGDAASGGGGGGGGGATGGEDLSSAGIESETMETETTESADLATGAAVLQSPGLIGNQFQVQIDVSRLPRLEEYMMLMDGTTSDVDDIPSDIKTVTYFVQNAGMIGGVADVLTQMNEQTAGATSGVGGLVRRSLDRFATANAVNNGGLATLNMTGDLLASEVVGIEFSYWDGLIWQLQWNSDEMGELPLAIQIQLSVVDSPEAAAMLSDPVASTTAVQPRMFTHVVRLPLARPVDTEEETTETSL